VVHVSTTSTSSGSTRHRRPTVDLWVVLLVIPRLYEQDRLARILGQPLGEHHARQPSSGDDIVVVLVADLAAVGVVECPLGERVPGPRSALCRCGECERDGEEHEEGRVGEQHGAAGGRDSAVSEEVLEGRGAAVTSDLVY
jgi:hypothetical protein